MSTVSAESASGLPPADDKNNSLLVVILTNLEDTSQEKLLQHFQQSLPDVQIKFWQPSRLVLQSVAHQGHYTDSQENLYGLAILCHRSGWPHFVVADGLTSRQVCQTTRGGEDPRISVIMMTVRPVEQGNSRDQVRVFAKRTARKDNEIKSLPDMLKNFNISQTFVGDRLAGLNDVYTDYGLELHDPDRGVLTPNKAAVLGREDILSAVREGPSISLPLELLMNIVSSMDEGDAEPSTVPSWVKPDAQHLNIFFLSSNTPEELRKTQSVIEQDVHKWMQEHPEELKELEKSKNDNGEEEQQEEMEEKKSEMTIHLVPWQHDRVASRRDVRIMWKAYLDQAARCGRAVTNMHLLYEPVRNSKLDYSQLVTVDLALGESPNLLTRSTLDSVMEGMLTTRRYSTLRELQREMEISHKLLNPTTAEFMCDPEAPFYPDPPLWNPVDSSMNAIPVFYLTKKLTDQQRRAISDELVTKCDVDIDDPKVCCYVPWHREDDGDLNDMWNITWEISRYNYKSREHCQPPYIFIDQQSAIDLSVTIVDTDFWYGNEESIKLGETLLKDIEEPRLRGISYGRVPGREAHSVYANLSISNMGFDELCEEVNKFPRPGWPGHGILRDEYED